MSRTQSTTHVPTRRSHAPGTTADPLGSVLVTAGLAAAVPLLLVAVAYPVAAVALLGGFAAGVARTR